MTNATPCSGKATEAVISLARGILLEHGHIRLGSFVAALQKGTTKIKYGAYVSAHWKTFQGISNEQLRQLYELIFRQLDQTDGPLTCQSRWGEESLVWGYAEVRCCSCGRNAISEKENDDLSARRARALRAGHPDAGRRSVAGGLPDTTLSLPRNSARQAA